ncbi:MAG: S41 family peptidase [Chloroflexota bacterium]|nr:S41 family peptidase [Anaerolineales bacterium]
MKKKFWIILTVILVPATIWFGTVKFQKPPQYPTAQRDIDWYFDDYQMDYSVSRAGLIKDVDTLVAFTDEVHADPYRVTTRSAFLEKAEEIKARIRSTGSEDIPVRDAFYDLQELTAFLQDGHTTLFPQNWEKTVDSMLPLTFTSVEGRIFVKDNFGDNDLPERAEIVAINDVSIEQMTDDLLKYVPGTLPHFKHARLAQLLGMFIQTYYKMPSPWQVTYSHNGTVATTTVNGISQESFAKASALQPEYGETEVEVNGRTVPVLELKFPGWNNSTWDDFKVFADDFFARNQDSQYLIIDARHHHGGDGDWMVYVLSHLTPALKGYREYSFKASPFHQQVIRYGFQSAYYDMKLPQFLWELPLYKLAEQDEPQYWIGRGLLESKPGSFYDAEWGIYKPYIASETSGRFQGKVFLLTSDETFSAGAYLAGLFRENHLGTIVGRETGGRVYMQSDMLPVILPNSNLMYMIPTAKFTVCDDDPDRGIIPDVTVDLTVEDYASQQDQDMEQVIDLIGADSTETQAP